jgi:hypothetical protein
MRETPNQFASPSHLNFVVLVQIEIECGAYFRRLMTAGFHPKYRKSLSQLIWHLKTHLHLKQH